MTQFLPPALFALFAPRPPIPHLPPIEKNKLPPYCGVGDFLSQFEDPSKVDIPPPTKAENREERKARRIAENKVLADTKISETLKSWDPRNDLRHTSDAFKTIFVARLNYETSEKKVKREFEVFGVVKSIRLVSDSASGKPRGYAFVEYENETDMKVAYKKADGMKIDGKRVLVDFERGRTMRDWRPRRLGGGLGKTRLGGADANVKHSGREGAPESSSSRHNSDDRRRSHDDHRERNEHRYGDRERDRDRDSRSSRSSARHDRVARVSSSRSERRSSPYRRR